MRATQLTIRTMTTSSVKTHRITWTCRFSPAEYVKRTQSHGVPPVLETREDAIQPNDIIIFTHKGVKFAARAVRVLTPSEHRAQLAVIAPDWEPGPCRPLEIEILD